MQTILFDSPGAPASVLKCDSRPQPQSAHGQVLVRMLASPINPSDLMFIRGQYGIAPKCPQTPGFEGVGIVEASGGGLRGRFFRRRRVAVMNRSGGNWAEYAVVSAQDVIPLSKKLSVEQASMFFVNPATAWTMTHEVLKVPQGAWLLQTAAASSLGRMVVRLGQHSGFRTLNVVRNEHSREILEREGATSIIVFDPDRDSVTTFADEVQRIVGSSGLRYAIDPVGGATSTAVLQSFSTGGRLLVYGSLSDQPMTFPSRTLMTRRAAVEGFWLSHFMNQKSLLYKLRLVRQLTRLITSGVLSSSVSRSYSLTQIQEAVVAAEEPALGGKILLRMADF